MYSVTPAVKGLLISNIIIFILNYIAPSIVMELILYPFNDPRFSVYQLITHQFCHGSIAHILFNMLALWTFGSSLELDLGTKKFLTFYLICGVFAASLFLFFATNPMLGASGAIFGLFALFTMMYPDRKVYLFGLFGFKAKWLFLFYFGFELYQAISQEIGFSQNDNVGHIAHLGGGIMGILLYIFDKKVNKRRKNIL